MGVQVAASRNGLWLHWLLHPSLEWTCLACSSLCSSEGYFWVCAISASVELVCLLESRAISYIL